MSQFFVGTTAGSLPPVVPTQVNTQDGNAVPLANVLLFNAYDSTENNDNGVTTKGGTAAGSPPDTGGGAVNEMDVYLTNRATGTVTTAGAALTTILTISAGAAGTIYVYGNVQAYNASNPASGTYSFSGGYRTDGAIVTELGIELHDEFEDPILVTADIFVSVDGANNIIVQVQGVAATSINWNCLLEYRRVS